jgi:hypothetical protein
MPSTPCGPFEIGVEIFVREILLELKMQKPQKAVSQRVFSVHAVNRFRFTHTVASYQHAARHTIPREVFAMGLEPALCTLKTIRQPETD